MKKKFAVVLAWDTESDLGEAPVMVGIMARTPKEAVRKAIRKAESGELYSLIYEGEPKEVMNINEEMSFACEPENILMVN